MTFPFCYLLISGYVDEMKKLLFSLSSSVMKEKFTEYSSKAPTSLASQFPDRVGRTEAVEAYNKRIKQNTNTQLFPTGNSSFFSSFLVKYQYVFMGQKSEPDDMFRTYKMNDRPSRFIVSLNDNK